MSGVIDERGVQWERCNCCGKFTQFEELGFLPEGSNLAHKVHGRDTPMDICIKCVQSLDQDDMWLLEPAASWTPVYAEASHA